MDKRIKMIFAGLCLGLMLVACTEESDTMPDLDLQELHEGEGIEEFRYNGDEDDTTRMGG